MLPLLPPIQHNSQQQQQQTKGMENSVRNQSSLEPQLFQQQQQRLLACINQISQQQQQQQLQQQLQQQPNYQNLQQYNMPVTTGFQQQNQTTTAVQHHHHPMILSNATSQNQLQQVQRPLQIITVKDIKPEDVVFFADNNGRRRNFINTKDNNNNHDNNNSLHEGSVLFEKLVKEAKKMYLNQGGNVYTGTEFVSAIILTATSINGGRFVSERIIASDESGVKKYVYQVLPNNHPIITDRIQEIVLSNKDHHDVGQQQTYYTTVRVQVPYEELLPGNRMVLDLPNTNVPYEIVVPEHVPPGSVIPVRVPTRCFAHSTKANDKDDDFKNQQLNRKRKMGETTEATKTIIKTEKKNISEEPKKQRRRKVPLICNDKKWMDMYHLLVAYNAENKTTRVPRTYVVKGIRLGHWVHLQADHGRDNTADDKKLLLDAINFDWINQPRMRKSRNFMDYYNELCEYHNKHNTTILTQKNGADPQLIHWTVGLRDRYKKNKLKDEQIVLLKKIDFDLERSNDTVWMDRYKEVNNLLNGGSNDDESENNNNSTSIEPKKRKVLGAWIRKQRESKQKGRLSQERIDLLNEINFDWKT